MNLLHIDSSITGESSASRVVSREIVERWRAAVPDVKVKHVDLAQSPLGHLSAGSLARSDAEDAARDTQTLEDFLAADVVVIGAPMYNFAIPSQLKAWIDRIAVAGKTFRYTPEGPQGLAGGKRVIVALSRGGFYPSAESGDHVEPYLRHLFGFLGIRDVTFVRAEGLALSPQHREQGLKQALSAANLVAVRRAA